MKYIIEDSSHYWGSNTYLLLSLENHHTTPFVPCGKELSSGVELNSGYDVSWVKIKT